ncbi:MAG: propanediol utilization protein [Veillonella sp.]|uniref:propanediol utilization protein n=1 Tax=Veillonella sp. TaxID=1926307 RepID=UPI0025DDE327|nr:propanediol utilization protein [Veillonella sp.]MBE6080955.1 propanediol utilization protein [Veillonella sp.]
MEEKQRMIQEYVPGKQITLAHIIANPAKEIYGKLGLPSDVYNALGILTITPAEAAIIAVDIATKSGDVSSVETALRAVVDGLRNILKFALGCEITRT